MKIRVKEMALVSIFTALTVIGAFISIPLGPVPITLQTLFVLLSGIILGPKLASLSQILYIFLALIGIPIFSGFSGGPQLLLKPSFGFAIGFVFAAYIVGLVIQRNSKYGLTVGPFIGSIVIYIFGLPYMYFILNIVMEMELSLSPVLNMGLLIFIPGDLLKLIIVVAFSKKVLPLLNH